MRGRTAVPAGLLDAGFAALAAFAVSIYAARILELEVLGYYAVFFTAFLTAIQTPGQLLLVPYEIHAMSIPDRERLSLLRHSLASGMALSAAAALAAAGIGVAITVGTGFDDPWPLAITMVVAATISPLQDHMRRMLHAAGRSWAASVVSIVQAVGVGGALVVLIGMDVPPVWVPFTALAVANVLSSVSGFVLARSGSVPLTARPPRTRQLFRSGAWLLATGLLGPLAGLAVNGIVIAVAGAAVLGLAEAARVVARPILVINTGLGQALAPRSIAAAQRANRRAARRVSWVFATVTGVGGAIYAAAVSIDWALNLAQAAIPNAYAVSGLVLAVCLSNIVIGISFPGRYELLGAKRESWVTFTEIVGQVGRSGVAAGAAVLGAFVIAIGDIVLGMVRILGYRVKLPEIYSSEPVIATGAPDREEPM